MTPSSTTDAQLKHNSIHQNDRAERMSHRHEAPSCLSCHDIKEPTRLTCAWGRVTLGSCHVTAMSHRCLECELCSLCRPYIIHSRRSHQPIHAEERGRPPCQGSLIPSPFVSLPWCCSSIPFFTLSLMIYRTLPLVISHNPHFTPLLLLFTCRHVCAHAHISFASL